MPEILKTRAIFLSKLNYGDTSKIVSLFTEDFGKMSAIIKGARSPKSKIGAIADLLNCVEIVFYQKPNRDVQLITQIELINHFPKIREDLDKLKYSSAVIELLSIFTSENETHKKLFKGTIRILELINKGEESIEILFIKFFIFFLKEIGYQLQLNNCVKCNTEILKKELNAFDYVHGILCQSCSENGISLFKFPQELFEILTCISSKNSETHYNDSDLISLIRFIERYLMYQVPEFKGLKSIRMY